MLTCILLYDDMSFQVIVQHLPTFRRLPVLQLINFSQRQHQNGMESRLTIVPAQYRQVRCAHLDAAAFTELYCPAQSLCVVLLERLSKGGVEPAQSALCIACVPKRNIKDVMGLSVGSFAEDEACSWVKSMVLGCGSWCATSAACPSPSGWPLLMPTARRVRPSSWPRSSGLRRHRMSSLARNRGQSRAHLDFGLWSIRVPEHVTH